MDWHKANTQYLLTSGVNDETPLPDRMPKGLFKLSLETSFAGRVCLGRAGNAHSHVFLEMCSVKSCWHCCD